MTATFGKLQGRSLELGDGLNIIEAPNETGKSTWCAFLLSILYGVNSRERDRAGFIADKNRFAPWSGAAMSGRMDCGTELGELTLTRATYICKPDPGNQGLMAEWLGKGLQNLVQRFESASDLTKTPL